MISEAEIINQPYSGKFTERIYDNQSPWNSSNWTWIKFTNHDFSQWCGEFRGSPREVAISPSLKTTLVLTSDYLYLLNSENGDILEIEDQPQYHNLTVSPNGEYIIADYYNIEIITDSIKTKKQLTTPIKMDQIKFKNWENDKLIFICDEFLNWDRHLVMELDSSNSMIQIKNDI